jgi:uncharacterized protein YjbI with pentapeptide repeats
MIEWLKRTDDWINRHRPWALLGTVVSTVAVVALINWSTESDLFRQFFFPKTCDPKAVGKCDPLEWKELFQATVLVLGLPVAFLLWHWRDRNVRDQIDEQRKQVENQRKDINLKEFQEVQLRAVGFLNGELAGDSKHILQIAALHQLRGFLRGDYGEGFKRPAFETYSALLSRWDASEWEAGDEDGNFVPNEIFKAVRAIVYEDWKWLFWEDYDSRKGWPLSGRSFHHIRLPVDADLSALDLSRTNFYGSHLDNVTFDEATCWDVNFSKCSMRSSSLVSASCEDAKFDDTDLAGAAAQGADMSGTSLKRTKFHGSDFNGANFYKVDGTDCAFVNTKLGGANFNGASFIGVDFQNSDLSNAKFVSARIYRGSIIGADVRKCDFSYAYLDGFYPSVASNCAGTKINSKTRLSHPLKQQDGPLLSTEMLEVHHLWEARGAILIGSEEATDDNETETQDYRIRDSRALKEALNAATKL